MKLTTLLNFGGNCAEALRFYTEHLGANITFSMTYAEMPEPKNIPPGCENSILHASIQFGVNSFMATLPPIAFSPCARPIWLFPSTA